MRKHRWAIIAGVCVVVLIVVGAVFIPRALHSSASSTGTEDRIVVMPGHWWKVSLDEQKIEILRRVWHTGITRKDLVDMLWPGVLQKLPAAAGASWERQKVDWPNEPFDDWEDIQAWCFSAMLPVQDDPIVFDVYLGSDEWETDDMFTVSRIIGTGLTSDNRYRVSMYTNDVLGHLDGPLEKGSHEGR
jgi:hypothetical protein